MTTNKANSSSYYTSELIDLVRLGVAFATLVEQRDAEPKELTERLLQLLPRIYAQTLLMPSYLYDPDEDYIEEYITEDSYEEVRSRLASLLGEHDAFLAPQVVDSTYGEESIQLTISECLADVYQHIGNLLGIIKAENTEAVPVAVGRYLLYWREYWGRQLLLSLSALHEVYVSSPYEEIEEDEERGDNDTDEVDDIFAYMQEEDDEL